MPYLNLIFAISQAYPPGKRGVHSLAGWWSNRLNSGERIFENQVGGRVRIIIGKLRASFVSPQPPIRPSETRERVITYKTNLHKTGKAPALRPSARNAGCKTQVFNYIGMQDNGHFDCLKQF
jgi:hypothetical protein